MSSCVVCEAAAKLVLCSKCQRSYDRMTKRTHDIASIIEWAAGRAKSALRDEYGWFFSTAPHAYDCRFWRRGKSHGPCTCGGKL